jgi:hypothetical protein
MFIIVLFTIAKLWKQPRCPTTDKWIKKIWYLYTMAFYSVSKKNEILSFGSKWMELENIMLSEVSQAQNAKNRVLPHMRITDPKKCRNIIGYGPHIKGENMHCCSREKNGELKLECG